MGDLMDSIPKKQLAYEGADASSSMTGGYTKYEGKGAGAASGKGGSSGGSTSSSSSSNTPLSGSNALTPGSIKASTKVTENDLHHIFDNSRHQLDEFLAKYNGDRIAAFRAIESAAIDHAVEHGIQNATKGELINVNGVDLVVRYVVVDKMLRMSTVYIPGDIL